MLFSADMAVASEAPASFRSSAIRPRPLALVRQGFIELLSRRRLIRYLVQADLKKKGADTLLGNLWWVIDPLLQMLVYVVLVTVIFARSQVYYPLFIFCAILPWKWFNSSIIDGIGAVVGMERLIKQIAFPKLVLPVASVFSGVVNFFFGMIPLAVLILVFYRTPELVPATDTEAAYFAGGIHLSLLLIPVVAAVQLLMTLPIAIVLAAINVFYRDVGNLARHVLRLAFYVSPGIYDIATLNHAADKVTAIKAVILINPWTTLFTAYRDVIYKGQAPDWSGLIYLSVVSLVLLALAILFFKRVEPTFAKVL
jgi:ABC-type polysaccharide/polyol phosphate export permease